MRSAVVVQKQIALADRIYGVAVALHSTGQTMTYGRLADVALSPFFANSNEFGEVLGMLTLTDPERMGVFVLAETGEPSPEHYKFIEKAVWKRNRSSNVA